MKPLLGHIIENHIPQSVLSQRNEQKSWAYGYDDQYDLVIISKDGTLGDIYEIENLKIGLPRVPSDKSLIINHDKKKKDQKWERTTLPKGLREENQFAYESYILEEYRRREQGVFVYINGEPEYFSGAFYFFLQWFSIGRSYPDFRYTQRDLMLFWEACVADPRSYGILYVKNRRLGWSTLQQSESINRGTNYRDGLIGIISKTGTDAKSHFRKIVQGFRRIPFFFKPQTDGTDNPKTELSFTKPAKRITHKTKADYQDDQALDTYIRWYNTDLNSMDSERIAPIMIIDEPGKFPKQVPFSEYWSVAKECLVEGLEIVGKAMVGSTINPPDKGGREFEVVWKDSDINKRNANNQTSSGLYRIFIPAEYNLRGFFDQYGYPILDDPEKPIINNENKTIYIGAKTYLNNKEDSLRDDPDKLASQKRKYPRTITDAFRSNNTQCAFNSQKLYEQLDWIKQEMPDTIYQTGDLIWEDGIQDGKVRFVQNPKGRFKIAWHPPHDIANRYAVSSHGKKPVNEHLGAFGCDPYNRGKTADGRGSQGAIHGLTKANMEGVPSYFFFLEYLARPEKVEVFYEDLIKVMVYYSMPAAIEQSNDELLRLLKSRGYRSFVLNRKVSSPKDLTPTEIELGGFPAQSKKLGDSQFYAVEAYINDHIGKATENLYRDIGQIGKMYFQQTLEQWLETDPENRTKYDAYISSSLAMIANQRSFVQKTTTQKVIYTNPFTKYNNQGSVSVIKH
ncbi:hypothetical protein [Capnocytophaga canis]|uniref:hypothetical protein n=1 Tax=Capnocytophaga canis TaxID=1848903 RepID=UPI0037D2E7A5